MSFNTEKYNEFIALCSSEDYRRQSIRHVLSGICDKKYDIVLDIGCNGGQLTALLDSEITVGHIYGIDISEDVIAFAKQNHMKDNISYIVQDFGVEFDCLAPELKALEGKVSLIFSQSVFNLIKDKDNLASNLYRLLSKGGKVYASITHINDPFIDMSAEEKALHERDVIKIPDPRTEINAYFTAFKSIGFDIISDNIIETKQNFKSDLFRETILPIFVSVYQTFLVSSDELAMKMALKQTEDKLSANARHYTNDTIGEAIVEQSFEITVFSLEK